MVLGFDTEKFDEGADALVRIADALEKIARRLEALDQESDPRVRVSSTGSWLGAETANGQRAKR